MEWENNVLTLASLCDSGYLEGDCRFIIQPQRREKTIKHSMDSPRAHRDAT